MSRLPDIKVVRTNFIINIIAVVLVCLVAFYVLEREYQAYAHKKRIAAMQETIQAAEATDKASLRLSREFRDLAANIAELEKFYVTPIEPHEFMTQITRVRPEELIFEQISFVEFAEMVGKKQVVSYQVKISGEVRSLSVLDDFKGQLNEWELLDLENYKLDIDEALQGRDAETGIFPYTLEVTLSPLKDKPANKGEDA